MTDIPRCATRTDCRMPQTCAAQGDGFCLVAHNAQRHQDYRDRNRLKEEAEACDDAENSGGEDRSAEE